MPWREKPPLALWRFPWHDERVNPRNCGEREGGGVLIDPGEKTKITYG